MYAYIIQHSGIDNQSYSIHINSINSTATVEYVVGNHKINMNLPSLMERNSFGLSLYNIIELHHLHYKYKP